MLLAGVIYVGFSVEDNLADRHNSITIGKQTVNNSRQGFRSIKRGIVEQADTARLCSAEYTFLNIRSGQVLPIKGVSISISLSNAVGSIMAICVSLFCMLCFT
jgi:hypothetical protein